MTVSIRRKRTFNAMSQLLKRTKKSCLKIFRKISSSKQFLPKKIDDIDDTINNNNNNNNNNSNNKNNSRNTNNQINNIPESNGKHFIIDVEAAPMSKDKDNHRYERKKNSTESLPPTTTTTSPNKEYGNEISSKNILKSIVKDIDEESPNSTILDKLTARLFLTADGYDFHRLQHLRSDTSSEIVQFDVERRDFRHFNENDIVFEKVKYKDDVRYFRHTPSTSSLERYRSNSVASTPDVEYTRTTDIDVHSSWHLDIESSQNLSNQFTNIGFQVPKEIFMQKYIGNRRNVIISQELNDNNNITPIVKWDSNGDSLDEDDDVLPHEYFEDFDKRLSKRLAAAQYLQSNDDFYNKSADSSLKSSSTTLETWVDEDFFC